MFVLHMRKTDIVLYPHGNSRAPARYKNSSKDFDTISCEGSGMAVALEQSQCLVDKDCKKETESLEKLRIYLKIVDNQFVRVDLLKLSLYSEVLWGKLDKCSVPSDVFNTLADVSENQDTALQKFLFALEVIGGRLRGTHCAEKAKALLKSVPPRLALDDQSRKYRFCQCLVRIAKEFPHGDPDTAQEMKNRLSKLIDCNSRLFEFNSMILVKLLQTQTVTEEDSTVLQRELQTCTEHCRNDDMRRVLNECTALLLDYHDNGKNIVHQLIPPGLPSPTINFNVKFCMCNYRTKLVCQLLGAII